MGTTIHYSGKLNGPRMLAPLLDHARLFCSDHGWHFQDIEERVVGTVERWIPSNDEEIHAQTEPIDDSLRGMLINPHTQSETVWLTFNGASELCFYMPESEPGHYWENKHLFTKTQFAPIEIHMRICEFLHLIQDNYFQSLEVHDEGEYFETRYRERLALQMGFLNAAMDRLESAMNNPDDPITKEIQSAVDGSEQSKGEKPRKKKKGLSFERGKKITARDPLWKQTFQVETSRN